MPRPYGWFMLKRVKSSPLGKEEDEMASIKEVLSRVRQGETVEAISRELDVREATLRAMIDFMAGKGYVEELEGGGGCAGCQLNRKCSVSAPGERKVRMYALTKKAIEHIEEA